MTQTAAQEPRKKSTLIYGTRALVLPVSLREKNVFYNSLRDRKEVVMELSERTATVRTANVLIREQTELWENHYHYLFKDFGGDMGEISCLVEQRSSRIFPVSNYFGKIYEAVENAGLLEGKR